MTGRFKVIFSGILMRVVKMEIHKGHHCCSPANHRSVPLIKTRHCCHGDMQEQHPIILTVLALWGPRPLSHACMPPLGIHCSPSSWWHYGHGTHFKQIPNHHLHQFKDKVVWKSCHMQEEGHENSYEMAFSMTMG